MAQSPTLRFVIVGIGVAALQFSLIWMFLILGARAAVASAGAYFIAFCVAFVGQHYWTFAAANARVGRTLPRYLIAQMVSATLAALAAEIAETVMALPHSAIAMTSTLTGGALSYVLSSRWAFAADRRPKSLRDDCR